jgi:hypothetical protein
LLLHAGHVRHESDSFQRRAMNFGIPKALEANNEEANNDDKTI